MRPLSTHSLARLRTGPLLPNSLRLVWLLGVLWGELGSYRFAVWVCGWPDRHLKGSSASITHVLLITDPQVHPSSHKHAGFFPNLHDRFYHSGLKRSWRYVSNLRPDVVVFLGDMIAGGRKVKDDDEYVENYVKFRRIFAIGKGVPVFHVPGNQDVGLNLHSEDALHVQRRYVTHFGPLNSEISISNHSFVFMNAPGLVEEDYQRARHHLTYDEFQGPEGGTVDFLRSLSIWPPGVTKEPTILFTHIPLSRPEGAGCGPLREHGTIRRGAGPGYQNTFGPRTSEWLLSEVKPARIFSGDDRDFCEYTHTRAATSSADYVLVRETTIKSFSPDRRINHPGFHLLSLVPPVPGAVDPIAGGVLPSLADQPCLLPSQTRMYTRLYAPLAALTFLVFAVRRVRVRTRPHASPLPSFAPEPEPVSDIVAARRKTVAVLSHDELMRWPREGTLFGDKHDDFAHKRDDSWAQHRDRRREALVKSLKTFIAAPARGMGARGVVVRVVALASFDCMRVMWPAALLWAIAMWYTG